MNRSATPRRTGFTLVELMVVAAIIAILAAMALGGMVTARQSANRDRTRATIAKIHSVIVPMYDEYKYRRVPINTRGMHPNVAATARLTALRDLMRMEMPERWKDITNAPLAFTGGPISRPSVSQAYLDRYSAITHANKDKYGSAECLYMIVTINGGEDARRLFQDNEIGDVDGDGLPEFIDAWGNPIYFLRWAPGWTQSDLQPVIVDSLPFDPANWGTSFTSRKDAAAKDDHDPFDTRRADADAWRLTPLIMSAGPDGLYDVSFDFATTYEFTGDPYRMPVGVPVDAVNPTPAGDDPKNGSLDHYDNIHNHQLEAR